MNNSNCSHTVIIQTLKKGGESKYGKLNPAQIKKLKMLTIASLGSKSSELTYDRLSKSLDVNNVRELEDLILDTIYEGLLFAKLDQAGKIVQVDHSIGRDVKKRAIGKHATSPYLLVVAK